MKKKNNINIKQFLITFIPTFFFSVILILFFYSVIFERVILLYLLYTVIPGLIFTLLLINKYKNMVSFIAILLCLIAILSSFWFIECSKSTYCEWGLLMFIAIFVGYILLIYLLTYIFYKIALRTNGNKK